MDDFLRDDLWQRSKRDQILAPFYGPLAGDVLQEVRARPEENDILKRLTRRRRRLVNERVRLTSVLHSDLQAAAPGLVEITRDIANLWFLNFLTCRKDLRKLAGIRRASLLKLPAIGVAYAERIQAWQRCGEHVWPRHAVAEEVASAR